MGGFVAGVVNFLSDDKVTAFGIGGVFSAATYSVLTPRDPNAFHFQGFRGMPAPSKKEEEVNGRKAASSTNLNNSKAVPAMGTDATKHQ